MEQALKSFRLDGKVALVTGAAQGIGAKCAEVFASAGAKVVVTDVLEAKGTSVAKGIRDGGGEAMFQLLNVTDEQQWQSVIEKTVKTYGGFHALVNNAAITGQNLVENTPLEEWRKVMAVNNDGVFLGTKHAILAMKPGGISGRGGSIINISSMCAMIAMRGAGSYSAAKGAVRSLTKVAALECGELKYGIRINSIHPGVILTELTKSGMEDSAKRGIFKSAAEAQALYESHHPIGRLGEPVEIAYAALYLASEASAFTTGAELVIDGGFTIQ
jgi:NAD(P)-dependent dehydrogenase (short-subunit alcohol dehydrogenase family)